MPARNPPTGGLPTRGRHDARCPMALHRPENPDPGLPSDPPGRRTGPKPNHRSGVPAPPQRPSRPLQRGDISIRPHRGLAPALRSLPPPEDFRSTIFPIRVDAKRHALPWPAGKPDSIGHRRIEQDMSARCRGTRPSALAPPAGYRPKSSPNGTHMKAPEVHASGAFRVSSSATVR